MLVNALAQTSLVGNSHMIIHRNTYQVYLIYSLYILLYVAFVVSCFYDNLLRNEVQMSTEIKRMRLRNLALLKEKRVEKSAK